MARRPTLPDTDTDTDTADRLRHSVARLARLMRQQDQSGLGATATAALASITRRGPISLGELAALEQVAPPTMTKVVEKLEAAGFVARKVDPDDRRVTRVTATAAGQRQLEAARTRRTAWLASRLGELDGEQLDRLAAALDVLERLTAGTEPSPAPTPGSLR